MADVQTSEVGAEFEPVNLIVYAGGFYKVEQS
jgi:hypothetical protein